MSLIQIRAPKPKPATARPVIIPFLSGNHFTNAAMGHTYASPIPAPPRMPTPSSITGKLVPPMPATR